MNSVQTVSTPFYIFKNKGIDAQSTRFQQAFNIFYPFNNVERPFQTPPTFGSTTVLNGMLKQTLKPFKRAITVTVPARTVDKPAATDVKKERHPSAWEQVFDPCQ